MRHRDSQRVGTAPIVPGHTDNDPEESLWTYYDLSRYSRWSEITLRKKVSRREIPFVRVGRSVRFIPSRMREFFAASAVEPEADR